MNGTAVHNQHALFRPRKAKILRSTGGQYRPNRGTNQVWQICAVSDCDIWNSSSWLNASLCLCTFIKGAFQAFTLRLQLFTTSPLIMSCLPSTPTKGICTQWWHERHALYACHSLEQEFSALPLRCKAGDGPHFDLNAGVELLVPHVPYSLDWCGYCFVLQNVEIAALLVIVTVHKMMLLQ